MTVRMSPEALLGPKNPWLGSNCGWSRLRECPTHKMLSCISRVKGPWGGPILNPVAWEMKLFQRLSTVPSGQTPELISFISFSCWWGEDGWVRMRGMQQSLPPPRRLSLCFGSLRLLNSLREMSPPSPLPFPSLLLKTTDPSALLPHLPPSVL